MVMGSQILSQHDNVPQTATSSGQLWGWFVSGILLAVLFCTIAFISPKFACERALLDRPILFFVALLMVSGIIYLLTVRKLRTGTGDRPLLIWIVSVGFLFRITLITSTPILEDDFYRYFWDGAVAAHGLNPYAHAPAEVQKNESSLIPETALLQTLAKDSGPIIARINNPEVRSIYPPLTQIIFAVSHGLHPWSIVTWRVMLFFFDSLTMVILMMLLQRLNIPAHWSVIYWWNPLLIVEVFNAAHMDVILFPVLLGAFLLAIRNKVVWAGGMLGMAVGIKVWPILLLPLFLRKISSSPKRIMLAMGVFSLVAVGVLTPMLISGIDNKAGLVAYSLSWEGNDSLFRLVHSGIRGLLPILQVPPRHAFSISRIVVFGLLLVWIGWWIRYKVEDPLSSCDQCVWVIAALFLLSPTQYPWYFLWMLPFLTVRPRRSLLLLTALLPLYYLRFYFDARHQPNIFDFGIVWLEFLPVWFLLIHEVLSERKNSLSDRGEVAA